MRIALALASIALFLAGCGDNLKPPGTDPDAAEIDAMPTDASIDTPPDASCPVRAGGMVGGPCATDGQCDSVVGAADGICLNMSSGTVGWPASGFCITKYDGCTLDTECGANNICVTINDPLGPFRACMPACGTAPCTCPDGQVCANNFAGSTMNKMACIPGNRSAIDGDRCTGFGECDLSSICRNDMFEHPGGQCMQIGCTVGNNATCTSGGDATCIDPRFTTPGTGCADGCTVDADCRVAMGYKCVTGFGGTGRQCRHPQTGDPCAADADCGDPAIWDCRTGLGFLGGYCTIQAPCDPADGNSCSSGSSVCYDPPGAGTPYCIDRCVGTLQGNCRTGYLCTQVPIPGPGNPTAGGCI